jgi:pyruvate formate lyase activating enzyme
MPRYKLLDAPETPVAALHRAAEIGQQAGLRYVYAGNVPGDQYEHTRCPECGATCIHRYGYTVRNLMNGTRCPKCDHELAMVI